MKDKQPHIFLVSSDMSMNDFGKYDTHYVSISKLMSSSKDIEDRLPQFIGSLPAASETLVFFNKNTGTRTIFVSGNPNVSISDAVHTAKDEDSIIFGTIIEKPFEIKGYTFVVIRPILSQNEISELSKDINTQSRLHLNYIEPAAKEPQKASRKNSIIERIKQVQL